MVDDVYRGRIDALEHAWQVSGRLGRDLTGQQWSRPARCPGWELVCVYAHASMFPVARSVHRRCLDTNRCCGGNLRRLSAVRSAYAASVELDVDGVEGPAWPTLDAIGHQRLLTPGKTQPGSTRP
jgi:hypothetical protein